jgi:hypothetical protein
MKPPGLGMFVRDRVSGVRLSIRCEMKGVMGVVWVCE